MGTARKKLMHLAVPQRGIDLDSVLLQDVGLIIFSKLLLLLSEHNQVSNKQKIFQMFLESHEKFIIHY